MEWYEQNFVNHRDWVLDNLELLGLDAKETEIVLLLDFMTEHRIPIDMAALSRKSGMSEQEVNEVISVLCAKKYLEIRASAKNVSFCLDGLYKTDTAKEERILDAPLFDVFETEFGRPLSQQEMEHISEWNRTTDRKLIIYALREARTYQKLSVPYIETILAAWKKKGYTAEMIEEGKNL